MNTINMPLEEIIDCKENIYKVATLAIKEATVLSRKNQDVVRQEYGNSKLTAVAMNKVLHGEVKYNEKTAEQLENARKIKQ